MTDSAASDRPLSLFLVAAEESGDRLGAALMAALRERAPVPPLFRAVGGAAMAAQGAPSLFPVDDLSIIGLAAIPRRLPTILRRIRETADAIIAARPDALIIIDSPDFTHRVARRVRAALPHLPIVDYVSPTVWAWRPGRARTMRRYVDHVLALLPFEPVAHRQLGGPPCTYVGHPLIERLHDLRPGPSEALRREGEPPVILALPGSRGSEIHRLAEPFGAALGQVKAQLGAIELVLPTLPHLAPRVAAATQTWPVPPRIVIDPAEKHRAFRTARAALAASGTVTLELALAGIPTVAAYRVSPVEAWVARRLIRVPSVILANLVLGRNVVPELLQDQCMPDALASELLAVIRDGQARRRQTDAFAELDTIMHVGELVPSHAAADVVLDLVRGYAGSRADSSAKG